MHSSRSEGRDEVVREGEFLCRKCFFFSLCRAGSVSPRIVAPRDVVDLGAVTPSSGPGRGRGRGLGIGKVVVRHGVGMASSLPAEAARMSPRLSPDDDMRSQLAYLEGLVPALNARIAECEGTIESLNAELEDMRHQLEARHVQAKISPGPDSTVAPVSDDLDGVPILQRRPSQAWVGTTRRAPAIVQGSSQASGSSSVSPSPSATASSPRALIPLLGGRRKEQVDERGKAVEKLIDSERKYLQKLNVLVCMYVEPVRHSLGVADEATDDVVYSIFCNADVILAVHKLFLVELLGRWARWCGTSCVGDVFGKFLPLFTVYREFHASRCGVGPLELDAGRDGAKVRQILAQADAKSPEGGLAALFGAMRSRLREYVGACILVNKCTDSNHSDYDAMKKAQFGVEKLLNQMEKFSGSAASDGAESDSSSQLQASPPVLSRLRSSSKVSETAKPEKKGNVKKKGTFSSKAQTSGRAFKDKKEMAAFEIQQRILADIQERERDPKLSEEERGRLKLQAAFAAQGKFEAALNVMAGKSAEGAAVGVSAGGSDSIGASAMAATVPVVSGTSSPMALDAAVERLMLEVVDTEFEKYFLGMYFYFVSWRDFLRLIGAKYSLVKDAPDGQAKRCRLMNILSLWLEMNPQLRHLVVDDGPKKKKKLQTAESATALNLVSPPSVSVELPSTPQKALPRTPLVVDVEARMPDSVDGEIVILCDEVVMCIVALEGALKASSDKECLRETRRLTETSLQLIELVQTEKDECEPEFVDEGQLLRGSVVSLTQAIVSVIKASFSAAAVIIVQEGALGVRAACDRLSDLAKATTRLVDTLSEEEILGVVEESGVSPRHGESSSIIQSLLGQVDGANKRKTEIYELAMSANAVVQEELLPGKTQLSSAAVLDEDDKEMAKKSFVEVMKEFLLDLAQRPAEQAFVAFYHAWLNMGTAEENFRKTAYRKSVNLTKFAGNKNAASASVPVDLLREVTPLKLAQQMAILEYSLFQVIPSEELFLSRFMDPERSPNFSLLVSQFNVWGKWAYSEVLRRSDINERAKMIGFLIAVARESLQMNNFNTSYALVAGLNFPGVSRLKMTWQKVSKRDLDHYESLLNFWSTSRNYKTYRTALKAVRSFLVLFLVPLF